IDERNYMVIEVEQINEIKTLIIQLKQQLFELKGFL
ncbi:MAG: hypothetical protein RLZZ293_1191, partial [Pseudomonadota bacterium]